MKMNLLKLDIPEKYQMKDHPLLLKLIIKKSIKLTKNLMKVIFFI